MSYYDTYLQYRDLAFNHYFDAVSDSDVDQALNMRDPEVFEFLNLLSPRAERYLEPMAQKAHEMTLRHFGRTIRLYAPLYLSNYCDNQCVYCSFNAKNKFTRYKLSLEEVDREAAFIAAGGIKHILILTGESKKQSPVNYIKDCVSVLKNYFHSISIEVYPLTEAEYASLGTEGVDGLTIYQETYDEKLYSDIHPAGPKKDYLSRLNAPERGAEGGMRQVNIGALLGLADWRKDAFFTGLHAQYLRARFPDVEIGVSIPRLRPHAGDAGHFRAVSDKSMVQILLALRLYLNNAGISLSTRERPEFRDHLVPLGITRMSAGSVTAVGGYTGRAHEDSVPGQFEIADHRSVAEIATMLREKGYDPIFKDWILM